MTATRVNAHPAADDKGPDGGRGGMGSQLRGCYRLAIGICGSVRIVGNEYAGGAAHAPQVGSQSVGRESNEQNYKGH